MRNCTIIENFGDTGAGICVMGADPLIENNTITRNIASTGAGIMLPSGSNARIIGNRIFNNKCVGTYSNLSGAGIAVGAYSAPYIYGNFIDSNSADIGAGIYCTSNYNITIVNNIISNNRGKKGAGIYIGSPEVRITNNLIFRNQARDYGGAIYLDYCENANAINNTMVLNQSAIGGAVFMSDGNMRFVNNIIHNNPSTTNKPITSYNSRGDWFPKFEYNSIENGVDGMYFVGPQQIPVGNLWRTGNISSYPRFIDTATNNFRLQPGSSAVDAGLPDTTGLLLPYSDIIGNTRVAANRVDMGAFEFALTTLPVRLLRFAAIKENAVAKISWTIDNYRDVAEFEVEKKISGAFTSLGTVSVISELNSYTFDDKTPAAGHNYYRLKVRQKSGAINFSDVADVVYSSANSLQLSPNPVLQELQYNATGIPGTVKSLKIYSINGILVYTSKRSSGIQATGKINVGFLQSGTYVLEVGSEDVSVKTVFIKR